MADLFINNNSNYLFRIIFLIIVYTGGRKSFGIFLKSINCLLFLYISYAFLFSFKYSFNSFLSSLINLRLLLLILSYLINIDGILSEQSPFIIFWRNASFASSFDN